jgi:uncharacterized membrane protein (DUF485 family)
VILSQEESAMASTPSTEARFRRASETLPLPPETRTRRRIALLGGTTMFVLFIAFPVLAAFTTVFDGMVSGVGVAYIVGFLEIVAAMAVAGAYCVWANRIDAGRGDTPARGTGGRS